MTEVREVARIQLATISGEFDTRAFECASGHVYLAMVKGEIGDGHAGLARHATRTPGGHRAAEPGGLHANRVRLR